MFTNLDVESTAPSHEQRVHSELEPLIPRDEKVPTKKEERVSRAQFLALCWALFVIGWTDGSTGPLLPRIQKFYDVSWPYLFDRFIFQPSHEFCRLDLTQCLGYLFSNVQSVMSIGVLYATSNQFQGIVVGALLNMPLNDKLGLGKVSS